MTALFQITTEWNGGPGGTGYTNLYFEHSDPPSTGAATAAANVRTFFSSVAVLIPSAYSLQVQSAVKVIEDTTGDLDSIIDITPPAVVTGGGAGVFAAPAGACIDWLTATVHGSRRMQGRTFLVPLFASAWQADGSLLDAYRTTIANAASTLIASGGPTFVVWGRPRAASAGPPPVTARAGTSGAILSSRVPDKAAVLTSRRD